MFELEIYNKLKTIAHMSQNKRNIMNRNLNEIKYLLHSSYYIEICIDCVKTIKLRQASLTEWARISQWTMEISESHEQTTNPLFYIEMQLF